MAATYTVLMPPTRVTEDEAKFVNEYRRANRVTLSETLRRCIKALQENGRDFKRAPYGSTKTQVGSFLVDEDAAVFIREIAFEKDISKCQIIRSAIDCMSKKEANV
jgi:hypothetical protein